MPTEFMNVLGGGWCDVNVHSAPFYTSINWMTKWVNIKFDYISISMERHQTNELHMRCTCTHTVAIKCYRTKLSCACAWWWVWVHTYTFDENALLIGICVPQVFHVLFFEYLDHFPSPSLALLLFTPCSIPICVETLVWLYSLIQLVHRWIPNL